MNLSRVESILVRAFLYRVTQGNDVERHDVIRQVEQFSDARCSIRIRIESCPYPAQAQGMSRQQDVHGGIGCSRNPVPGRCFQFRLAADHNGHLRAGEMLGKRMKAGNLFKGFFVPDDDELPRLVVFCRRGRHGRLQKKFNCCVGNRFV